MGQIIVPGDATAADVKAGKKFSAGPLFNADGAMVSRGTAGGYEVPTSVAYAGGTIYVRIPSGAYVTSTGIGSPEIGMTVPQLQAADAALTAANIKAGSSILGIAGTFTSDATATATDIAAGKTAYKNGALISGSASIWVQGTEQISLGIGASKVINSYSSLFFFGTKLHTITLADTNNTGAIVGTITFTGTYGSYKAMSTSAISISNLSWDSTNSRLSFTLVNNSISGGYVWISAVGQK